MGSWFTLMLIINQGLKQVKRLLLIFWICRDEPVQVLQQESTPLSLTQLAEKVGATDQIEAIYKILRHLYANQRGVALEGDLSEPSSLKVSAT